MFAAPTHRTMNACPLFATLLFAPLSALATDRVVEEFGISPTYPNITAAVNAAVDGDRIVIMDRAGSIPWIEDITVNKSLQFLSYANNSFFTVQGLYTVVAAPGRSVTFIGMKNTDGDIVGSGSGTVRATRVRIIDCLLIEGHINLDIDVFDTDVMGNTVQNGYIAIGFGNVIGNDVNAGGLASDGISVTPSSSVFAGDTCWIAGNKVTGPGTSFYNGIYVYGIAQVYHIRNNFVRHGYMGLRIYAGNGSSVQNTVWNNTVDAYAGQFSVYGIILANTNTGSIWEVMNNVVVNTWGGSSNGIYKDSGNSGQINVYFNHVAPGMNTAVSIDFTFVSNNTSTQTITLNPDGSLATAPGAIDGANPANVFKDLDLTTGDAGAYGGSYTLENYHPLHTGAARIGHVVFPFNVRQGGNLRVKATSFDR